MGRIGYCEVCGVTEQRRAAEIYDGVDNAPDACWQCERALKFEQERIIKLLEDNFVTMADQSNERQNWIGWQDRNRKGFPDVIDLLALIKGDN